MIEEEEDDPLVEVEEPEIATPVAEDSLSIG
jgi:hypothetical protein